ncbi:hypothetical protein HK405_010031 [Cladochytrium tenue]|nr:hypothetical protein HK405_010031 [Cladochytrium tenue]
MSQEYATAVVTQLPPTPRSSTPETVATLAIAGGPDVSDSTADAADVYCDDLDAGVVAMKAAIVGGAGGSGGVENPALPQVALLTAAFRAAAQERLRAEAVAAALSGGGETRGEAGGCETAGGAAESVDLEDGKSKLGFVWGLLRRLSSVKDIASVRLSLPANLLDPRSNLEFWNYCDRPDLLASVPDAVDPVERMLRVVRWFLSKDTKWKDAELRKPYNPVRGETFACHWDVVGADDVSVPTLFAGDVAAAASEPQTPPSLSESGDGAARVYCLTEQILHHPPVSAFYYDCPSKGVTASGVDHVSARFTGTAVKVGAGHHNGGVYVGLRRVAPSGGSGVLDEGEDYIMTYPWASINGWLSGRPYITVSETSVFSCPQTRLRCVLRYVDDPFFGSPKFAVDGRVFRYDPAHDPLAPAGHGHGGGKRGAAAGEGEPLATLWGAWNGRVYARVEGTGATGVLLDLRTSEIWEKQVAPEAEQAPEESRRLWAPVSAAIARRDFGEATRRKRDIEERQRRSEAAAAAAAAAAGTSARPVPRFFRFSRRAYAQQHHHHHHHDHSLLDLLGDAAFLDPPPSGSGAPPSQWELDMERGKPFLVGSL